MLAPISSANIASASIKTHAAETRAAGGEQASESAAGLPEGRALQADRMIEPSGNTALASVDAVKATAGNRTVLQLLAFALAAQVQMTQLNGESLDAFFQRLATALMNLKDPERFALELRSGLKSLNIHLNDLAKALLAPDGPMAARIAALAEAPKTPLARAAAAAATSTYLQEGLAAPRTVEAVSIEAAVRFVEGQTKAPGVGGAAASDASGARTLQSHLQAMFEPSVAEPDMPHEVLTSGDPEIAASVHDDRAAVDEMDAGQIEAGVDELAISVEVGGVVEEMETAMARDPASEASVAEMSSAAATGSLPEEMADASETNPIMPEAPDPAVATQPSAGGEEAYVPASPKGVQERAADGKQLESRLPEKSQQFDKRLETMFVLKGLSEVVTVKPAEPSHIVSQPDPSDPFRRRAMGETPREMVTEALVRIEKAVATATAALKKFNGAIQQAEADREDRAAKAATANDPAAPTRAAAAETQFALPKAASPEYIPFAYAPAQPVNDEFAAEQVDDEHRRGDQEGDERETEDRETPEERRERLARKATDELLDAPPEEPDIMPLNRDSSEADRAYAMYQRLGGF